MKIKYDKATIVELPIPASGQKIYWFKEGDGFGIRVTPTARSLIFEKRVGGVKRRVTVRKLPSDIDKKFLDAAKIEAKNLSAKFANGIDPVAEKKLLAAETARLAANSITLGEAFRQYAEADKQKGTGKGTAKKPRTRRDILKSAETHFSDWLKKPITTITGDMAIGRHKDIVARADAARIKAGKAATGRSAQADLAMRYLRATMNHVNDANDDDEPIVRLKIIRRIGRVGQNGSIRQTRNISDDQIPQWVEAVRVGFDAREFGPVYRDALLFILLTGARLAEVMGNVEDGYAPLTWGDVDLEGRTVTFRNTKNRSDHKMPMGEALTAMMTARKQISGPDAVFSDIDGRIPVTLRGGYDRIKKLTGIYATPHDLRRTFATVAGRLDISEFKLKRLLNHTRAAEGDENTTIENADTTSGYVQISINDLREPMQRIESHMLRPFVAQAVAE